MNYALALSGGGVRGYAHIGVIRFLEEKGLRPRIITGSSAGAIIGAVYAHIHDPSRIEEEALRIGASTILDPAISLKGNAITRGEKLSRLLKSLLPRSFKDLDIKLIVTATRLRPVENEYFSSGNLPRKVLASSAYPFVFPPVRIGRGEYIDGGLTSPLPLYMLPDMPIIAVNVFGRDEFFMEERGLLTYIESLFYAPQKRIYELEKIEKHKLVEIKPRVTAKHTFDFSMKKEIMRSGYIAAKRMYKEIERTLYS